MKAPLNRHRGPLILSADHSRTERKESALKWSTVGNEALSRSIHYDTEQIYRFPQKRLPSPSLRSVRRATPAGSRARPAATPLRSSIAASGGSHGIGAPGGRRSGCRLRPLQRPAPRWASAAPASTPLRASIAASGGSHGIGAPGGRAFVGLDRREGSTRSRRSVVGPFGCRRAGRGPPSVAVHCWGRYRMPPFSIGRRPHSVNRPRTTEFGSYPVWRPLAAPRARLSFSPAHPHGRKKHRPLLRSALAGGVPPPLKCLLSRSFCALSLALKRGRLPVGLAPRASDFRPALVALPCCPCLWRAGRPPPSPRFARSNFYCEQNVDKMWITFKR